MDWDELKKVVSSSDKIIIVDKGEPSFVVTTFDYYRKNCIQQSAPEDKKEEDIKNEKEKSVDENDLTIDDLPF